MNYSKVGSIIILEKNGLKVSMDYDEVISKINDEINGSYIYETGEANKNLYYFGRKGVTKEDYINSLEAIKVLVDSMFCEIPTFDVFEYLQLTKKGKFALNRRVNLASPVVGRFWNNDYYKYADYLSLLVEVQKEDLATVKFTFLQSDVNKFEPIFFEDYATPIIREKLSAIKKKDLEPGHIYSDEKQKKFFIYVGKGTVIRGAIYRQSKVKLPETDFTDEEIEYYALNNENKRDLYLFVKLNKKQYEALKKVGGTRKAKEYVSDLLLMKIKGLYLNWSDTSIRVFHDEGVYLEDNDDYKVVERESCYLLDNTDPHCYYEGLPKETLTCLHYCYIQMLRN